MNISTSKTQVRCDACDSVLSDSHVLYPNNHNNISLPLTDISKHNKGDSETAMNSNADILDFASKKMGNFCDEACLLGHLQKRAKILAKIKKTSKASYTDEKGNLILDITSDAAYVSYKERNESSTHYLDEKRKSFPIRKGHECTDLEAAVSAWGRYRGEMSHDEFVSKVKRLMSEHGCPIPKAWKS